MKEEESVVSLRYLSPVVKQDLAELDKDGERRRIAMQSLKAFVDQLDCVSMPRFLNQVLETRESGGPRPYAVSLVQDVAQVHGKLVVPHIPRVMNSLMRALSASGSSPQLHLTCAKVVAALACYTIDASTPVEEAEQILRLLSQPLTDAIAAKLEPVAAGAATCLHALVDCEKWKYASEESIHEVCQRATAALSEKSNRTVAHMQLVRLLATINPVTLSIYGASLLKEGEEILKGFPDSWQHRKFAVHLLQAVLAILDKETLALELPHTVQTLESCRLDKMIHVRAAIGAALQRARMLISCDWSKETVDEEAAEVPVTRSVVAGSNDEWHSEESPVPPVLKFTASPISQESHHFSFSPASTATSDSMDVVRVSSPTLSPIKRARRTPLFPAKSQTQSNGSSSPTLSPSSPASDECGSIAAGSYSKDKTTSGGPAVKETLSLKDEAGVPSGSVRVGKYSPLTKFPIHETLTPPVGSKQIAAASQQEDKQVHHANQSPHDSQDAMDRVLRKISSLDTQVLSLNEAENYRLASRSCSTQVPKDADLNSSSTESNRIEIEDVLWRMRLNSDGNRSAESIVQSKYGGGPTRSSESFGSHIIRHSDGHYQHGFGLEEGSQSKNHSIRAGFHHTSGCEIETTEKTVNRVTNVRSINSDSYAISSSVENPGGYSRGRVNLLTHHFNLLAHQNEEDDSTGSTQKSRMLISAKDFLPCISPRRLVQSLQSDISSSFSKRSSQDHELTLSMDEIGLAEQGVTSIDVADMDLETSSDAEWSVHDNLRSEELVQKDGRSQEDVEERHEGIGEESSDFPHGPANSKEIISPRKLQMASTCHHRRIKSVDSKQVSGKERSLSVGADSGMELLLSNSINSEGNCGRNAVMGQPCSLSCCNRAAFGTEPESDCQIEEGNRTIQDMTKLNPNEGLPRFGQHDYTCSHGSIATGMGDYLEDEIGSTAEIPVQKFNWGQGNAAMIHTLEKMWRKLCWYAEITLGGSLCVVLSLPLALAVVKALTLPQDDALVPT